MRKRLTRFGAVLHKEMIQPLRDRRTLAIVLLMPFPFVAYAFCSRMLYEFTQHSLDADELKYYFSASRLLFGALKYYDETRASSSRGDLNFYKKMINAPIRLS